ncbi:MAG: tetratricopeptide repeat protein [Nitrospira sp.]|nr:tetratricopeptide repeat protein [Nitrospira sp.]
MHSTVGVMLAFVIGLALASGCQSVPARKPLSAPTGTITTAVQHHEAGILAYEQNQWPQARQHFEAAITAAPGLAEAHYNLGMALYKLKDFKEGDRHFIEAANLAPGHTVIWNSPPLRNVHVPGKTGLVDDGHGHVH